MTKDVLVSVRGIHTAEADGENGNVEVITAGTYYYKNIMSFMTNWWRDTTRLSAVQSELETER